MFVEERLDSDGGRQNMSNSSGRIFTLDFVKQELDEGPHSRRQAPTAIHIDDVDLREIAEVAQW
jgi:hypothetical protein